ncbi:hypothetical protein IQ06DRAFT_351416 [Phaeosphaeriaceae sp. SRC1lsM3a]|nr:hypothetical protein IQ06DRAFT_351416 [Stagonospora sp. SRC1lsM3a]
MPYAHPKNTFKGAGNPKVFDFGTTMFVTEEEAKEVIINTFVRPLYNGNGSFQPIILIGHAIENNSTISIVMGLAVGIKERAGHLESLKDLLEHFRIKIKNLHTAGTDAACTLVVAILIALKDVLYPAGNYIPLPAVVRGRNIQDIINHMMALGRSYPPPPWGRTRSCTRCD